MTMNKNIIKSLAASMLVAATACEDYNDNFDGLQSGTTTTDVKTDILITLSASDYTALAENATNIALTVANGDADTSVLRAISANKCFATEDDAAMFIPAYMPQLFPTADEGSKISVAYNLLTGESDYMSDFASIGSYTLNADDYASVWGSKVKADFLSPTTTGKIPAILSNAISSPAEGDMVAVSYAFSDVEPSIGGGQADPTWTLLEGGNYSAGSSWNYVNTAGFDLTEFVGQKVNVAVRYTSSTSVAPTVEVKNMTVRSAYYADLYAFAKGDAGYTKVTSFAGEGEYVFAGLGVDGQYYPFGKTTSETKSYGYMYPSAIAVTDGVISLADGADQAVTVTASGDNFVLKNAWGKYIYMSGTYDSFQFSTDEPTESSEWSITSNGNGTFAVVNVDKEKAAKLTIYSGSYSYGCYAETRYTPLASYALTGDAGNGGFTTIDTNLDGLSYVWSWDSKYGWKASGYVSKVNHETESWLVSEAIDLSEAASAYLDFDCAINYLNGNELSDYLNVYISTDYATINKSLKAASVNANKSALYVFDGSEWVLYTNADATVEVVEPQLYTTLGSSKIDEPKTVLPTYLAGKYPYASVEDRVVVVYSAASGMVAADYVKSEQGWEPASVLSVAKCSFSLEAGAWTPNVSSYLESTLMGDEAGFVAYDVALDGLTYVWSNSTSYGWKASGYSSGNKNTDSYLVSPVIKLTRAKAPVLSFEEAINYASGADVNDYCTVLVSTNFEGDPSAAAWNKLELETRASGSDWTFVAVSDIDLSAYCGSEIVIAFRYTSDADAATTWEFKNLSVSEKAE